MDSQAPIQNFYADRFAQLGNTPQSVGWGDKSSQELRFEVLLQGAPDDIESIVDVGCGLGHLVPWLRKHFPRVRYLGLDICREFISHAQDQYGDALTSFQLADARSFEFPAADLVVASGAFSYRPAWTVDSALDVVKEMARAAHVFASANFLSDVVDYKEQKNLHFRMLTVQEQLEGAGLAVRTLENYGLFEFTIQVRKQ